MSCFRINLKRCPRSISRGVPGAMSCCRISHVLHLKSISSKPRNLEFINFLLVVQRQWSSESTRGQRFSLPPLRGPLRGLVCHLWEVWFVTYERFCLFTSERLPLLIFLCFNHSVTSQKPLLPTSQKYVFDPLSNKKLVKSFRRFDGIFSQIVQ